MRELTKRQRAFVYGVAAVMAAFWLYFFLGWLCLIGRVAWWLVFG